jgi:hypothetical protein
MPNDPQDPKSPTPEELRPQPDAPEGDNDELTAEPEDRDAALEAAREDAKPATAATPPPSTAPSSQPPRRPIIEFAHAPDGDKLRFLKRGADPAVDFVEDIREIFTDRAGGIPGTAERYCGFLQNFARWLRALNLDIRSIPPDTAARFLVEAYPSPVTRRGAESALRSCYEVALQKDLKVAHQEIPITQVPPKRSRAQREAEERQKALEAAKPSPDIFGPERTVTPPASRAEPLFQSAQPVERPAPTREASQPARSQTSRRSVLPALGGRVRITKRVDGTEGLSMPIGTVVLVGNYSQEDIEGKGSLTDFIVDELRPIYGPFRNQRPTVYYADRLDNIGNVIPNSTTQIPVMPHPQYDRPQAQAPMPQAAPQNTQSVTGDKFFDFIVSQQQRAEQKAEQAAAELRNAAAAKGVDPTMLMLISERLRPEPLDLQKLAQEWKRANKTDDHDRDRDLEELFGERGGGLPGTPSARGFAGMESPRSDGMVEAVVSMMKEQGALLRDALLTQRKDPAQSQVFTMREMVELAKTLMPPAAPPPPPDPFKDALMQASLARLVAPPEKPKTLTDLLGELKLFWEAKDAIGGEEKPLGFGEIVAELIQHAPEVGRGVSSVLAELKEMRAPDLGEANGKLPGTKPAAVHNGRNGSAVVPPLNDTAKAAFIALKDATDPQVIVNNVFDILQSYAASPEPWPTLAKKLIESYKNADSRLEVMVVITNLYMLSRAKAVMTAETVERITQVFTDNYSMLHEALTGTPRALANEKPKRNGFVMTQPQSAAPTASTGAATGSANVERRTCLCDPMALVANPRCPDHGEPLVDTSEQITDERRASP